MSSFSRRSSYLHIFISFVIEIILEESSIIFGFDRFGFSAPGEEIIRNMLIKFRDEIGFILVDLNNGVFTLTEQGITELKRLDQSLV